ncbi:MAG TPA: nucleotidyltransferase domain-containing protein [Bacteroidia bacterium]|nr:nucleotidyltransferase domain-containing protein [Bacteroidia bacterium]
MYYVWVMMHQTQTISTAKTKTPLNAEDTAVVQCLLYFDAFNYPLKTNEIYSFLNYTLINKNQLQEQLDCLVKRNLINKLDDFYFVNESNSIVERRIKGNNMAHRVMPKALRYGKFIAQFPFVETVCISGALSKNYFDENGDVDFFIITKPQRLWLCRSILVGFKKIFLLNSRKYFCVNYFVGSDNLSIPDRNIFTSTEIASLIPVSNNQGYAKFIDENQWIYQFLPNFDVKHKNTAPNKKDGLLKKMAEWVLNGNIGNFADKQLFRLTLSIWQKKFKHFNKADFDLNMRSRKNVSKHHPSGFQQKVLTQWALNKENFSKKHHIFFTEK